MRKSLLLLALLCTAPAQAASPVALTFLGYGQSTMFGSISGDLTVCGGTASSGSTSITISNWSSAYAMNVGGATASGIYCGGLQSNPITTIASQQSGTAGQNGAYTLSQPTLSAISGTTNCDCVSGINSTFTGYDMTLVTPSNINANAFMIATSTSTTGGTGGPRPYWETLDGSNAANNTPVITSRWTGFTQLHENMNAGPSASGNAFSTETPMSSLVAQYVAMTGLAAPNAIIAANMAHGGEDWVASYLNILGPGGLNDWANYVAAQKFIKNNVQGSSSALSGTGFPTSAGPWTYHLGGVFMRLGESAAQGITFTASASWALNATTITGSGGSTLRGVLQPIPGWCVYDYTTSTFSGYAASLTSTTITLANPGGAQGASSGSADTLWLSPCYPGYLAELKSMLAQITASDVSDAPTRGGVPIFSHVPSSTNFTPRELYYGFQVNAANGAAGLADRRFVVTGPSFAAGPYQSDGVHGLPRQNAMVGAYMGKWAAWYYLGYRTAPFVMTQASIIAPAACDGTHYCIRVSFLMPPSQPSGTATAAQQQTLQIYTDANIPSVTNAGFCYMDGAYAAGGSNFPNYCGTPASGITISSVALANTEGGANNQIDLRMSANPSSATNPTVSLGARSSSVTLFGSGANVFVHNVANQDCTLAANAGIVSNSYGFPQPLAGCAGGAGSKYLIDFAAPSFITVGQALSTAW